MRIIKFLLALTIIFVLMTSASVAGDFDWIKDLSVRAEANLSDFKARLATRFKIGNAEISAVLSNVDNLADAYMVLRLGEMSGKSSEDVISKYKSGKGKGWGALAKSLGIKPGSKDFKALKNGDDLYEKGHEEKKGERGKKKK